MPRCTVNITQWLYFAFIIQCKIWKYKSSKPLQLISINIQYFTDTHTHTQTHTHTLAFAWLLQYTHFLSKISRSLSTKEALCTQCFSCNPAPCLYSAHSCISHRIILIRRNISPAISTNFPVFRTEGDRTVRGSWHRRMIACSVEPLSLSLFPPLGAISKTEASHVVRAAYIFLVFWSDFVLEYLAWNIPTRKAFWQN